MTMTDSKVWHFDTVTSGACVGLSDVDKLLEVVDFAPTFRGNGRDIPVNVLVTGETFYGLPIHEIARLWHAAWAQTLRESMVRPSARQIVSRYFVGQTLLESLGWECNNLLGIRAFEYPKVLEDAFQESPVEARCNSYREVWDILYPQTPMDAPFTAHWKVVRVHNLENEPFFLCFPRPAEEEF